MAVRVVETRTTETVVDLAVTVQAPADHTRTDPVSLLPPEEELEAAVTGTPPLVHPLPASVTEVVVATVDLETAPVQPVGPLGPTEPRYPHPVPLLPAVEALVVLATAQVVLVVVGMVVVHPVEVPATVLVLVEVECTDHTAAEVLLLDVEVVLGGIQVHRVQATLLHKPLQVEGDIPMVPHHHNLVDPATVKDTIRRASLHIKIIIYLTRSNFVTRIPGLT